MHNHFRNLVAQSRTLPRNLTLFFVNVFVYIALVEGISAVLLNLYLRRLGYGTEFVGTLNSIGLLVFALVSLPIGAVQRYSSRRMMQLGQIVTLIGLLGIPLAYYVTAGQAGLMIGFRAVTMVGLSIYFVHQIPFVLDITAPEWHNRALAVTMAIISLSAFAGSWIGGVLPELFSSLLELPLTDPRPFQLPLLIAPLALIPAFFLFRLIPETRNETPETSGESTATLSTNWRSIAGLVLIIVVVRALQTGGIGVINTFSNIYFDEVLLVPTGRIGLISGAGRLLAVPVSLLIPYLVVRYGNFKLVTLSLVLIVLLILPLALVPFWPIASLALIMINSMGALRYLTFVAFTLALVSTKHRGLMTGASEMAIGVGFAISSLAGGYLIAWFGYRELFLFGASMTAVGAIAFWLIFRKRAAQQSVPATVTQ